MSTLASLRPVAVIAGIGNCTGTGAATARLFAKQGYSIALIARSAGGSLNKLTSEINEAGGESAGFQIPAYTAEAIASAFSNIHKQFPATSHILRVALFNVSHLVHKPFLEVTPEDVKTVLEFNVVASFAFAHEVIAAFKTNPLNAEGKRGTLIITGATASIRGNFMFSAFSAANAAKRMLSQSLAKEFGKDNIHVGHAVIDGAILTDNQRARHNNDPEWEANPDIHLDPGSIAKSYLHLVNQDRTAWTWEMDLRPSHEKW